MLRVAFLGCGWATRLHSRTLAGALEPLVLHYASRDPAKAQAFARQFGGRALGGYAAALDDADIDAIVVATPPAAHLELTVKALHAGKDVVVEKPAFLRAADVMAVRRACAESGRRVFVAENYHYKPLRRVLRRLIARGAVGEPRFLQVNAVRRQRIAGWREEGRPPASSALFEGGIHWIHFLAGLGLSIEAIRGIEPGRNGGPDRSMLVVVEYGEGPVATLHYSWEIPSPLRGLRLSRVWGTDGGITFETNGLFLVVHGRRWSVSVPSLRDVGGYRAMWRDFLEALRLPRAPSMTLDLAERDLKLVETIFATLD